MVRENNLYNFHCAIDQDLFVRYSDLGLLNYLEKVDNWEEFLAKNCEEFKTK